jgi:K+-transporting ATPase ATPase A chain
MSFEAMGVVHIGFYFLVLVLLTKPLGAYMANVFEGKGRLAERVFAPVERPIYRVLLVDAEREMDWKRYALSVVMVSVLSSSRCTRSCGSKVAFP